MTVSKGDAQALTWIARRLREDTHGCGPWDPAGTYAVISELIGQNLAETVHRVVGHAVDPEARTPGAIRRPFVPKRVDEPGPRRQPAKAGEDCRRHPGEYATGCRACAADLKAGEDGPTVIRREKPPADVAHRGAEACRAELGETERSTSDA